ncbi:MAG: pantetheine-phosphate adenylyltransferase [Planctomycetales bacterium 4572_13]|nr:MAG: pantetheine-phosphate adenylyltransferase [Planctomycetales bacterium 4572_13]
MEHRPITAIFPGSFDPITNGHLDVIRRGNKLFDNLVIAVGQNPGKDEFFSKDERVEMIRELVTDLPRVTVESYDCLTVKFAEHKKAQVMLRGMRNLSDVQYEFQLAMTNRTVAGIETVFVMTSEEYGYVNSTMVRQLALLGGDVSKLIPNSVYKRLRQNIHKNHKDIIPDVPE